MDKGKIASLAPWFVVLLMFSFVVFGGWQFVERLVARAVLTDILTKVDVEARKSGQIAIPFGAETVICSTKTIIEKNAPSQSAEPPPAQ